MAGLAHRLGIAGAAFAACVGAQVAPALAQQPAPAPPATSELSDRCPGLVAADPPRVVPAAFKSAALADGAAAGYRL